MERLKPKKSSRIARKKELIEGKDYLEFHLNHGDSEWEVICSSVPSVDSYWSTYTKARKRLRDLKRMYSKNRFKKKNRD